MIISMQKIKDINFFLPVLLPIKESFNLTGWETQQATPNHQQVVVSGVKLFWWLSSCKETKITWFFPQILMIKEPYNLIGWETQVASPNQNR